MVRPVFAATFLLIFSLNGCRSFNIGTSVSLSGNGENQLEGSYSGSQTSFDAGFIRIQHVLPSRVNAAQFDIISEDDGAIGDACGESIDGSESLCECEFEYTDGSATQLVSSPSTRSEGSLFRCSNAIIPSSVDEVTVRLVQTENDTRSNSLTVSFGEAQTGETDLSVPESYSEVKRFQCRDYIFAPYPTSWNSTSINNPFVSELPYLQQPLNFFASNPGGTLLSYTQASNSNTDLSNWDCEFDLNSAKAWSNPVIFSRKSTAVLTHPVTGEIYAISDYRLSPHFHSPGTNDFDRSSFFVSRNKVGRFSVPILSLLFPGTQSSAPNSNGEIASGSYPPIGYAARPQTRSGYELCPSSSDVEIPYGYRWVKLFAFRASLDRRQAIQSSTSIQRTGAIVCDPGDKNGQAVFPDCDANGDGGTPDTDPTALSSTYGITDSTAGAYAINSEDVYARALLLNTSSTSFSGNVHACFYWDPTDGVSGNDLAAPGAGTNNSINYQWFSSRSDNPVFAAGFDWNTLLGASSVDTFPWGIDSSHWAGASSSTQAPLTSPSDELILQYIDGNPRNDFTFVVAPEFVTYEDIEDAQNNLSTGPPDYGVFVPFRANSNVDCDPSVQTINSASFPTGGFDPNTDCRNKTPYGLIRVQLTDTGGDTDTTNEVYPLCVLQKVPST